MDVLQRFINEAQAIVELLRKLSDDDSAKAAEIWEQAIVDLERAKQRLTRANWFPWKLP